MREGTTGPEFRPSAQTVRQTPAAHRNRNALPLALDDLATCTPEASPFMNTPAGTIAQKPRCHTPDAECVGLNVHNLGGIKRRSKPSPNTRPTVSQGFHWQHRNSVGVGLPSTTYDITATSFYVCILSILMLVQDTSSRLNAQQAMLNCTQLQ